jgi:hypothetical protein
MPYFPRAASHRWPYPSDWSITNLPGEHLFYQTGFVRSVQTFRIAVSFTDKEEVVYILTYIFRILVTRWFGPYQFRLTSVLLSRAEKLSFQSWKTLSGEVSAGFWGEGKVLANLWPVFKGTVPRDILPRFYIYKAFLIGPFFHIFKFLRKGLKIRQIFTFKFDPAVSMTLLSKITVTFVFLAFALKALCSILHTFLYLV